MFLIKEVLRIILRAKLHFLINLISLTISVFLISLSFIFFYANDVINKYIQDNLFISIFLKDEITDDRLKEIESFLKSRAYTSKVEYISKEKAYDIFLEETGEDFRKILDVNPLPASFNLYLKSDFIIKDSLNSILIELSEIQEVDEVISKMEFFEKIFFLSDKAKNYILLATLLMIFISVYLVFSTNKLIINSNSEKYETMKLVGAKLSTIKLPILLNIMLIGFLAGLITLGLFYLIINFLELNLQTVLVYFSFDPKLIIICLLVVGPFFGVLISIISMRKISLRIKT